MTSRNSNFLVAHYDWLIAGLGVLALLAGVAYYVMSLQEDADEAVRSALSEVSTVKSAKSVQNIDMDGFLLATNLTTKPPTIVEIVDGKESFLSGERRAKCVCGAILLADVKAMTNCPCCKISRVVETAAVLDEDGDGMPDAWEVKYGLNPKDPADAAADKDGDDFTNLEEYEAKTDPTDRRDHPEYIASLKLSLPLKETYLPFVFRKANKIPSGWRLVFFDPKLRDDYNRLGATITAVIGEEIGKSGYVVKSYEAKSAKQTIKGTEGLTKTVDVSEATIERKSDGKLVKLVIQEKGVKPVPVDVQATLVYARQQSKTFDVVVGSKIDLSGEKYSVTEITSAGKGAKVTVENAITGKKTTLSALE